MRSLATGVLVAASVASAVPAATVSVEVASQRGLQATAHQQWLQLLSRAGAARARIRTARQSESPSIETLESRAGDVYRVTGVLTSGGRLVLPGGQFTARDAAGLRDYFDRLKADGPEAMTAVTGNFGLTREQFESVFESLSRPVGPIDEGVTAGRLLESLRSRLDMPIAPARGVASKLKAGGAIDKRLGELSIGTALALALQGEGLALVPTKPRGRPVELTIVPATEDLEAWPMGYEVTGPPRAVAPDLMQSITVEIDGFTLTEATNAITPRLELPVIWDHAYLAEKNLDPATIQVKLPRAKLSYKRILEKLLFQARLRGQLRTDEAGTPFYWISGRR